jgi:hypothetical protein
MGAQMTPLVPSIDTVKPLNLPVGYWKTPDGQRYFQWHEPSRWERFVLWFQGWRWIK